MAILVTGGAGFIGSHTCVELLDAGKEVVVLDNLCNANPKSLDRVQELTGKTLKFYEGDIRDRDILQKIFRENEIESVIHFAGLKAVGESVQKPLEYYDNNINGTITLVDEMRKANVKNIIFSSSATIYGNPAEIPITENCPKGTCTNPYGWTKWMIEQILIDIQKADPEWNVVIEELDVATSYAVGLAIAWRIVQECQHGVLHVARELCHQWQQLILLDLAQHAVYVEVVELQIQVGSNEAGEYVVVVLFVDVEQLFVTAGHDGKSLLAKLLAESGVELL